MGADMIENISGEDMIEMMMTMGLDDEFDLDESEMLWPIYIDKHTKQRGKKMECRLDKVTLG